MKPSSIYRHYVPVITISRKGKILVSIVRAYYKLLDRLGKLKWKTVWPDHHEDPSRMNFSEQLYLGQKYYYQAMLEPERGPYDANYFAKQTLQIKLPAAFNPQSTIMLNAGGDLIPYTCITPQVCKDLWRQVGDFFFGADIVFANLESPADYSKPASAAPEVMLHDMYFNINADMMRIFCGNGGYKGYDVVSVANNHSLDMGVDGLMNTMRLLQEKQIAYCGAAMEAAALHDFPIIERQGIKIAFIAATFCFNKEKLPAGQQWLANHIEFNQPNADISLLQQQTAIARQRGADLVVAALHAGCAYQAYPGNHTINNMHRVCDEAGADVLLVGHAHHAQPMEIYESTVSGRQHFIAYSLGDFIAYDIFKWGHLPMLLQLQISKGTINGQSITMVTGIRIKAAYMHATIRKGKVQSLELLDYKKLKSDPTAQLLTDEDRKKFEEVKQFFETIVLPPHLQHLLV